MKPFLLDRLNYKSPYSVWSVGSMSYSFKTDYSVVYRIEFIEDDTIWKSGAYEFAIINENGMASPNDEKVKRTISSIIEEFFTNNPDVLIYQCETGDNRQAMRDRLFLRWFNSYERNADYVIKVEKIVAEGIENYTAIIVQKSNPKLETILSEFEEFVDFFRQKPSYENGRNRGN